MNKNEEKARSLLTAIYPRYDRRYLATDPIQFPHLYQDTKDQELVALLAALLAFGNAKAAIQSIRRWLAPLGPSPTETLKNKQLFNESDLPDGHRWVRAGDILLLLKRLALLYKDHETLEDLFLKGISPEDPDIQNGLEQFSQKFQIKNPSRGFQYFFPSPAKGSACKRLNLFLRWVVRPSDGIDLGLWKRISPSKLIVPVDIHVYRFAKTFRLTHTRTANWKMAKEVTVFLKKLDPDDPVKYDFSICHWGMEKNRK